MHMIFLDVGSWCFTRLHTRRPHMILHLDAPTRLRHRVATEASTGFRISVAKLCDSDRYFSTTVTSANKQWLTFPDLVEAQDGQLWGMDRAGERKPAYLDLGNTLDAMASAQTACSNPKQPRLRRAAARNGAGSEGCESKKQ